MEFCASPFVATHFHRVRRGSARRIEKRMVPLDLPSISYQKSHFSIQRSTQWSRLITEHKRSIQEILVLQNICKKCNRESATTHTPLIVRSLANTSARLDFHLYSCALSENGNEHSLSKVLKSKP